MTGQTWPELPEKARDAIRERFPGLAGPLGAPVLWKTAGDPTTGLATLTGFVGGRLIAAITVEQ